jgi:iron complex outermembrane receptor protein
MNWKHALLASSTLLAASIGATANAQAQAQAQPRPAAAASAGNTIEELVVTAEKREQSLQDVPIAISAFTAKQRDVVGITTIQDYTNFTPGLVYSTFSDRASIRGIGRLSNIHAVDAAVAIYIDGVYTTSTVLAGGPPLQVDRVEVLRGPQGTLYGRNSIGGTINIITPRPTDHLYAEVRAIGENYGFTNFQVAASGPINDNLRVRFSGYKLDQRQGYYDNVNPGMPSEGAKRNEWEYQFQVDANLGEHVEAWVKYESLKWDDRGGPGARSGFLNGSYETGLLDPNFPIIYNPVHGYTTETGANGIVPGSLQQYNGGTTTTNPALQDPHDFNSNTPLHVSLDNVHVLATNVVYHAPTFDIKYIGGLQNYNYDLDGDGDASNVKSYQIPLAANSICGSIHTLYSIGRSPSDCAPLTVNGLDNYHYFEHPKWFSNEINITSTTDSPLQWIAGLYYYHETYSASTPSPDLYSPTTPQLQTPVLGAAPNPTGVWNLGDYKMTTESEAAFGQLDWKATDTLKFTAGLRYTKDHKFGAEYRRVVCFSDVCMPGLYTALGLNGFGPGTAANWGSLLGNLNALPGIGQALGLGNALAPLAGLGNGGFDLTTTLAPTTTAAGAKGVTDPVTCNAAGVCTQYKIDPATGNLVRHLGDTSDAWTGTLGVQWDPTPGTMGYARYSRGYKAFGFAAGSALDEPEAKPEFVNSYELGLKKNFGPTIQVNGALYYLDYRNLQAPVSIIVGPTTVDQFINIAKSRSMGLELDAIWQPIQPLRISLDYSYNNTRIQKSGTYVDVNDNVNTNAVSVVGNRLPQAPLNKVAVNANYTFDMSAGSLTVGGSYIYRDKAYANIFTQKWNEAPSWDQVDLRATWAARDNKYTVIAYVRNVFDTLGYDAAVPASQRNRDPAVATDQYLSGAQNVELTPPRTFGIELQYRFF